MTFLDPPDDGMWSGDYRCTRHWADSTPDGDWLLIYRLYRLLRGPIRHYGFVGLSREDARQRVTEIVKDIDWAYYLASK